MKLAIAKTWAIAWALTLGLLVCSASGADDGALVDLTLDDCYRLALKQSETVAIQQEIIKEAEGRFRQSISTILPQVSFVDEEKWQDGTGSSGSSSTSKYVPQRQFVLTQPLFSGFKEFAAIAASRAERRQRRQELVRARQLLFIDVSDAFYLLKSSGEDLKTVEEIHQALTDRMDELKKRESLGRSRASEVASAEARLYQTEADLESVRSQEEVARQLLEFLVGKRVGSIAGDDVAITDLAPFDEYVQRVDERPDVQAAEEAHKVASKTVTVARAGYYPKVDAVGNYYTKRTGSSEDVDWDALITITVPLFTGGQNSGLVKEALAKAEETRLLARQVRRQGILEIQNTYTRLTANKKQTDAYKKAVDAARKNYDFQVNDYRNSLVNNLDVLEALQDLQTVERSYIVIKNETQRSYWALKVATGDISDDTF